MHSIFVLYSVILCMMEWAFFNINIHDYCCDGQKCTEAKVEHASDSGTWVRTVCVVKDLQQIKKKKEVRQMRIDARMD